MLYLINGGILKQRNAINVQVHENTSLDLLQFLWRRKQGLLAFDYIFEAFRNQLWEKFKYWFKDNSILLTEDSPYEEWVQKGRIESWAWKIS